MTSPIGGVIDTTRRREDGFEGCHQTLKRVSHVMAFSFAQLLYIGQAYAKQIQINMLTSTQKAGATIFEGWGYGLRSKIAAPAFVCLVRLQATRLVMLAYLLKRLRFNLADTFTSNSKLLSYFFKSMVRAIHEAVTHFENLALLF